jgi:hypothetical protein
VHSQHTPETVSSCMPVRLLIGTYVARSIAGLSAWCYVSPIMSSPHSLPMPWQFRRIPCPGFWGSRESYSTSEVFQVALNMTYNARISGKSLKSSLAGIYMNHLDHIRSARLRSESICDAHGMRCGWNHSVNKLDLMTTEFVLISRRNRPLQLDQR